MLLTTSGAGKLHVRFDEGVLETETTVRSSETLARKGRNGLGSHDLRRPPRQRPTLQLRRSQWRALRTTNAFERINEEFRRRTKTQANLPCQDAVLLLLFALLGSGQIKLRTLDGYQDMKQVKQATYSYQHAG